MGILKSSLVSALGSPYQPSSFGLGLIWTPLGWYQNTHVILIKYCLIPGYIMPCWPRKARVYRAWSIAGSGDIWCIICHKWQQFLSNHFYKQMKSTTWWQMCQQYIKTWRVIKRAWYRYISRPLMYYHSSFKTNSDIWYIYIYIQGEINW